MTGYGLICPFLTDNPVFAYGVEFGILYAKMNGGEGVIEDYFCRQNQDQILLLASRLRWRVASMSASGRDWIRPRLEKLHFARFPHTRMPKTLGNQWFVPNNAPMSPAETRQPQKSLGKPRFSV